jgi:hypothetical protein
MDEIDLMQRTQEIEFKGNIQKSKTMFRLGPKRCVKCNEFNDRYEEGFGVCTDCMEINSVAILSTN